MDSTTVSFQRDQLRRSESDGCPVHCTSGPIHIPGLDSEHCVANCMAHCGPPYNADWIQQTPHCHRKDLQDQRLDAGSLASRDGSRKSSRW